MEYGILVVRVVVGLLLAGHGLQKLGPWLGGAGPAATGQAFAELGYRHGRAMAVLAGLSEVAGGLELAAGLLTPFAAAAVVGTMVNAIVAVHARNGLWAQQNGFEYPLVVAAVGAGVALTGPGPISLDAVLFGGYFAAPWWAIGAIAVGLLSGLGVLASRAGATQAVGERHA